jgi:hypothetical protein
LALYFRKRVAHAATGSYFFLHENLLRKVKSFSASSVDKFVETLFKNGAQEIGR